MMLNKKVNTFQMKATEQYFPVVLVFSKLNKVVPLLSLWMKS